MAAVVETWIGELAKLKEKVKAKTQKPLLSEAKEETVEEKEGATKEARMAQRENMLSETTVCLLMDRLEDCERIQKHKRCLHNAKSSQATHRHTISNIPTDICDHSKISKGQH
ncbi:hypothetical protein SO802_028463 [Lithocarpus litseifolius]|uniref:Uncharacterized protein n=1 Tax=Lithocarpus litseifolius TaxID=425828 RepID=A0AAW2BQE2_9ROSI